METPLIFIHIPKTAGSSIRKALNITYTVKGSTHFNSSDKIVHDLTEILQCPPTKFAVVRNPYDRAWSIYKFFHKNGYSEHTANEVTRIFLKTLSPEQFWLNVDVTALMRVLPHVRTQSSFVNEDVRILRFENLEADWNLLLQETGRSFMKLSREMESPGIPWQQGLSEAVKRKIEQIYATDFDRFGYQTEV